jgi:hypothetical protein
VGNAGASRISTVADLLATARELVTWVSSPA